MRIKEISLSDYGKYSKSKESIKFSENRPNLVYGKNEAGKSTIVSAITELLFGFYRTKKDNHKYLPWGGDRLNISMVYLTDLGAQFNVKRLLSSSTRSVVEDGLVLVPINNKPIPDIDFMSKKIFDNVHTITSEQLKEIETKSFSELQDKLVLNYGNSNVSPKKVEEDLKENLKKIYNSRSTGHNQVINKLMKEIRELKKEKKEKINIYSEMRIMIEDIEKIKKNIDEIDGKIEGKTKLKNTIRKYLNPIDLVNKINNLKLNIENYENYEKLDKNILKTHDGLKKELEELEKKIKEKDIKIKTKKEKIKIIDKDEKYVLLYKDKAEDIDNIEDNIRKVNINIDKADEWIDINNEKIKNECSYIFDEEIDDVEVIDFPKIRTLYYKSKEDESHKISTGISALKTLILLALLAVGIFVQNIYGIATLGVALIIIIFEFLDKTKNKRNKSFSKLKEELKTLKVKNSIIENFTEINLKNIENIFEITNKNIMMLKKRELLVEKKKELGDSYNEIFKVFENIKNLRQMNEVLTIATSKVNLNKELEEDLKIEEEEFNKLKREEQLINKKWTREFNIISKIGENDFEKGYLEIENYLIAKKKIEHYESELSESFNLKSINDEISKLDRSIINEEYLGAVEGDIELLQEEKSKKNGRKIELKSQLEHKIKGDTLDIIDGKIQYNEEQLKEYGYKYDILSILNEAVKRADEKYREKNQPDVLKLTANYFKKMTNGRYENVLIEEDGKIYIKENTGEIISADSEISAGTKNQLYLSFRLAFIKFLDKNNEKLPIILDEVFSNWDIERLEPTLNLLGDVSKERQLILFTCKEENIRYLERYMSDIEKILI